MQKKIKGLFLLIILGAIWGSSFILMKLGMEPVKGHKVFTSSQVAGLRMLFAGMVMLPFAFMHYKTLFSKNGKYLLLVGLCGNFIPSFLFTYAGAGLSSGLSGILNSFTPVFTALLGFLAFKVAIHKLQIAGIFIGIIGIIALILSSIGVKLGGTPLQIGAVLLATFLYGISLNTIRHKLQGLDAIQVTSLGLLAILPLAFGSFFITETQEPLFNANFRNEAILYILILGVIGTAISNIFFNRLIKLTSALFASSVTYLIPIFAVMFGQILNEKMHFNQLLSMLIILLGVFFVNFHESLLKLLSKKKA